MEHFGAVFKLDLTEETRTQLQEEAATLAIASSCLILSTSMLSSIHWHKSVLLFILNTFNASFVDGDCNDPATSSMRPLSIAQRKRHCPT